MLPNFLVIGAMKSATTSLCALLAQHPEIFFCPSKEISFFNRDDLYLDKGMSYYEAIFEDADGYKAIGEGSIEYSRVALYPETAERIAKHLPEAKVIYMVRHPIDRIESQYSQRLHNGQTILPFVKDVRLHPDSYIDTSNYWKQINVYRALYPDDRILVLFFDDFWKNADAVLKTCFKFLDVDPDVEIVSREVKNPRSLHQQDTLLFSKIKRIPFYHSIRLSTPKPLRNLARKRLRMPVNQEAKWDEATLRWVTGELQEASHKFLEFYGKPTDSWHFDLADAETNAGTEEQTPAGGRGSVDD